LLLSTPLNPALYPRGTFTAAAGLLTVALYYHYIWGRLKNRPESQALPAPSADFTYPQEESAPFAELDYLYGGLAISSLTFLLAGSADTPATPLDHLLGALMGLCGVIFAAMFAVGLKLATDVLKLKDIYEVGIIVSGDGDYVPAVQAIKDWGKHVVNVSFLKKNGGVLPGGARRLNQCTDRVIELEYDEVRDFMKIVPMSKVTVPLPPPVVTP